MATILLEGKSESTIKLLIDLAKKLGLKMRVLDVSELEDIKLGQLMNEVRTNELEDEAVVLKKLAE
ncbi:MAG: hypothetical protein K0B10_15250 [Vicingaceae bacterium]|nr:hypothetical protein [Vicingaceae bacterium]